MGSEGKVTVIGAGPAKAFGGKPEWPGLEQAVPRLQP